MASLFARVRATLTSRTSRPTPVVEFCESCAQVCDSGCRAAAYRARVEQSLLTVGFRL